MPLILNGSKRWGYFSIYTYKRYIYYRWTNLFREGIIRINICDDLDSLKIPKIPKRLPKLIRNEEIKMLFEACDLDTNLGYRNYLLLGILCF